MYKIVLFFGVLFSTGISQAQTDSVSMKFGFKITDYIKPLNDSTSVVQVQKPENWPVSIAMKQVAVLSHCYHTGTELDTARIGWGRCQLIKGDYYYFGMHLEKNQQPAGGDLLFTMVKIPSLYQGLLLHVIKNNIVLTDVTGNSFFESSVIFNNGKKEEQVLLDSMVADIRYTGKAMLQQSPAGNIPVKGGEYDGKNLFTAMQTVTASSLEKFLKYMEARPAKYAGNTWKLSEIFATWMINKTPVVLD